MTMKTLVRIHNVEQGTPEWHQLRDGLYTGSNADKLLKFGAIDYSKAAETGFGGNFYTRRGHKLEDEAIALYEQIAGRRVTRPGFVTNDAFPGCGYSPDGLDGGYATNEDGSYRLDRLTGILLEVKCFTEPKHLAIYEGETPFKILAQIHFGLFICGLKEARLIIYNPDMKDRAGNFDPHRALKIIPVKANRNIANNFKNKLLKGGTHALYTNSANA